MDKKPLHLLPSHCLSPTDSHCTCCCHVTAHSRNSFNILPGSADHDNLWKFSARSPLKCMHCQASIVNVCAMYAFIWQHQGYSQLLQYKKGVLKTKTGDYIFRTFSGLTRAIFQYNSNQAAKYLETCLFFFQDWLGLSSKAAHLWWPPGYRKMLLHTHTHYIQIDIYNSFSRVQIMCTK